MPASKRTVKQRTLIDIDLNQNQETLILGSPPLNQGQLRAGASGKSYARMKTIKSTDGAVTLSITLLARRDQRQNMADLVNRQPEIQEWIAGHGRHYRQYGVTDYRMTGTRASALEESKQERRRLGLRGRTEPGDPRRKTGV